MKESREPNEPEPDADGEGSAERGQPGSEAATHDESKPSTPLTQQIGRVVLLLLLVLFVVFALDNAQRVDFSWVLGETQVREDVTGETRGGVPLIVLLLASFAIGSAVGAAGVWQAGRTRRRAAPERREAD